ncbi:hypothetical protein FisN_23Hh052 [Fistulifera solaris]|uniref:Uncharacterized protein n=1 Tax=Fistulifera solaris TaxID=1519565 RepID=A0A1Z5KN20_FISSO|nr:hypothetical protein FisN_23Hh052 [Fistulifera solaris]|eukprot:GAX27482.1 hypothetical protein FisN_23Hh052 [Fistulifera solaris]
MKLGISVLTITPVLCTSSATEHLRSLNRPSEEAARRNLASHPSSVEEANNGFIDRKVTLIKNWIANRERAAVRSQTDSSLHDINAGFFVFANADLFDTNDFASLGGLPEDSSFDQQKDAFLRNVSEFVSSIEIFETVGTDFGSFDTPGVGKYEPDGVTKTFGGDWDFVLTFLSPTLYQYVNRTDLLSIDMRWALLRQGTVDGEIPYSGNSLAYLEANLFFFRFKPLMKVRVRMIETENHILQIYTWKYLINNYVRYIALLDPSDERYDPRVAELYTNNSDHYNNSPELVDVVLQMIGIILHNDLFETNSKPYEAYSVLSLLLLYSYADRLFPDDENNQKVKTAAHNALDFLAVKFAFQTFQGKRISPMRRNWSDRNILGFYENDHLPTMYAALSGVNFFPMPTESFYFLREGMTILTALMDYRLPEEIHDYMLDRHDGFWARMQSSYYTDHFHLSYNASFLANRPTPVPDPSPATYFKEDGSVYKSGVFRPIPQVYFGTNDFLNSAGGCGRDFLKIEAPLRFLPFEIETLSDLRAVSKPNILINRPDYSYYADNITLLEEDYLIMRGEADPSMSKNLNTYKSFTFGYLRGKHDSDKYKEWPMTVPRDWNSSLALSFSINRANFRIYDFSKSVETHPMHGYYVITAKVSKLPVGRDLRSVARGFWEIVPARMYETVEALASYVRRKNPSSFFSKNIIFPYKYVLATTGEKIKIDARAGGVGDERCSAFRAIWGPDGRRRNLKEYHFDTLSLEKMEDIGLVDVWEIDSNYMIGNKIASAPGDGRLFVKNRHIGSSIEIDGSDYRNPKRKIVPL